MKKHDESKDLALLARNGAKIDFSNKVIKISKLIGNRTWGRLDFLIKYKGWFLNRNGVTMSSDNIDDYKEVKHNTKEVNKLSDKRKKKKSK